MTRIRSSMVLLVIAVAAMLIGVLRLATQHTPQPPGSSSSAQPDGTLALYTWLDALGATPSRLTNPVTDETVKALLIIQPATLIDRTTREAFDAVALRGGTLTLAGDSIQWLLAARQLGVTVEPLNPPSSMATTVDGSTIPVSVRYRLRADGAEPILLGPDGDWVGLRQPYKQGALVVIASADPFTNAGLADPETARFVYRQVVSPTVGQAVAFDDIERLGPTAAPGQTTFGQLLFATAPGRAVLYSGLLIFAFLLLSGRRLGPAVVGQPAAESQRTMYEHVQMLANLYRRAGQLGVLRATFDRHYARLLANTPPTATRATAYAEALARIQTARTESELLAAVASVPDDAS